MKVKLALVMIWLLGWASLAVGQAIATTDQVPDSTAYRLHFVAIMNGGHVAEYLKASGVAEDEVPAATTVLSKFKKNYDALIAIYNADPETLAGRSTRAVNFIIARETLIRSVRAELGTSLTADSMSKFDAHVQTIKSSIKHNVDPLTVDGGHAHMVNAAFYPGGGGGQGAQCNPMTPTYDSYVAISPGFTYTYTQVPLNTSMFTYYNLTGYNPSQIADGNLTNYGWHTDASTAGAELSIDLGTAKAITKATIYADSSGYAGNYNVWYSDDNINWTTVATGFVPNQSGANSIQWSSIAHRYWTLYLTNTPGPGAWLGELQFFTTNTPAMTVYSSMVLEGYTNTSGSSCSPITHQGQVTNNLGHHNYGTVYGSHVSPPTYISLHANETNDCSVDCTLDPSALVAIILCSKVGQFFSAGGGGYWPFPSIWNQVEIEIAATQVKSDHQNLGEVPGNPIKYKWASHPICSPRSSPPDMNVTFDVDVSDADTVNDTAHRGWLGGGFCFRGKVGGAWTSWVCTTEIAGLFGWPGGLSVRWPYDVPYDYDCTNKDAGFDGLPVPWPFSKF